MHIRALLSNEHAVEHVGVFNLADSELAYWDEGEVQDIWHPLSERLAAAEGFVFVVPEWHGMVPPKMKNLLLYAGNREFAHKPCLIVSVSSGLNGVYPVVELKSASAKNNHLVYIPNHVIIRKAEEMLRDVENDPNVASNINKRLNYSLTVLKEYTLALKPLRRSAIMDPQQYPYGM